MKQSLLVLAFFQLTFFASAQSYTSNSFSRNATIYERIDIFNEEGNTIVSIAPRFYKHLTEKKKVKPIKVNDETYFIKIEKFRKQSVYTKDGEQVADMDSHDATIHLVQENITYSIKPRVRLANFNVLKCQDSNGDLVSELTFENDKKLHYNYQQTENPNNLLMALCVHQYQELLLGDRGRLSVAFE